MKTTRILAIATALLLGFDLHFSRVCAQGTAFTYQGRLNNDGSPANGSYDFTFALFNQGDTNSVQIGATQTNPAVAVSNGLFTVTLDFGATYSGAALWLEIAARTNGQGAFTVLSQGSSSRRSPTRSIRAPRPAPPASAAPCPPAN